MSVAIVGVGTNLGAREAVILGARDLLDARPEIDVVRTSTIYETEPLGPPQGPYLNAAFRLETSLPPPELLRALLRTERRLGRKRSLDQRWGPRSVDLDLLWDARGAHAGEALVVPHPELENRAFALGPTLDVAPELDESFGDALARIGGRPDPWIRGAIVKTKHEGARIRADVEADSLVEACALCASFPQQQDRPWSTRHVSIKPSPDRFAEVLRELFRTGFSVCCTTISHCSKSQWVAQFHGVNMGIPIEADVRLETTAGVHREARARLSVNRASS